ncbi:MAG TPA: winged helix-turn-helix domain-containing protein [Pyrinomonadaceae bacterium]|jgi:TolB-like protein/Flp pilus assembly protein TadD|nr:winged helix-turn-helix domain-containing protein [Pyrinomonadaceae bacterium]
MSKPAQAVYEFGPFRLDQERYLLLRHGDAIQLSPKAFEILLFLVAHRGEILKKDFLIETIWPDTFVEESNLAQNIFLLRKALGEEKNEHRYIVTLPGVGYRFVAAVREIPFPEATTAQMPAPSMQSIAVLPFKSIIKGDEETFLGPGLADALIMRLSSIRNVKVRPTSAVLKYTDFKDDPLQVGRELNVDALLTGVIQRENENVRVSVQLVSVRDGVTLWAEKFDEKLTNIFAIQDSISEQVVHALALQLSGEERRQIKTSYTDSPEAFQLYLKGRYFWNQRTAEGLRKALQYAQQAIDLEPTYANAYVGLADSYNLLGAQHSVLPPRESFPRARAAALRALEIDPQMAEAYASLGFVDCCYGWDWNAAEQNYLKTIELKPNYPTAHHWYGELLTILGRAEESAAHLQLAQESDPLSLAINADNAAASYYAREYKKSEGQLCNLLELNPRFVRAHVVLGKVYTQQGKYDEALQALQQAVTLSGSDHVALSSLAYTQALAGQSAEARRTLEELKALATRRYLSAGSIALIHAALGETETAFEWLEKAFTNRDIEMVWLKVDPVFDPLRGDERLTELTRRVSPALL